MSLALSSNVLSLSDAAAERVRGLLRVASSPVTGLRVSVEKGGCAGMSYKMDLAEPSPGDEVVEQEGARVIIDAKAVLYLLGTRMVLNELVAFSMLGPQKAALDPRSFTIATFALCGFANLSSIGIQIGGIGALAPNKRGELARLGFRAMLAGTMANLMSASIAGMLL